MRIEEMLADLHSDRIKNIILDTDTYNEVDDQFALSYALMKDDRVKLLSVNSAPFLNTRSTSPEDGMLKSYDEIKHILSFFKEGDKIPVYLGSRHFLESETEPVESEACDNIINTVLSSDGPVYVVAIAAITNVASAIIKCPEIVKKMRLIWLGGHVRGFEHNQEFNLYQDVKAARVVFESGVSMLQLPCIGVVSGFAVSQAQLKEVMGGSNSLSDYLIDIVIDYYCPHPGDFRVIWDITAIAALTAPDTVEIATVKAKTLADDGSYTSDLNHDMLYAVRIKTPELFKEMTETLASGKGLK